MRDQMEDQMRRQEKDQTRDQNRRQKRKADKPYQKKVRTMMVCLGCAAVMGAAASFALPDVFVTEAQAAESSVIESLSVTFESVWGDPEEILEPEIRVSGSGISLADVQFGTDFEKWKPGKKVRVEITIMADEGKYFPTSLGSSKCKVTGATFVSAKALDDNTMQVKADYLPVSVLGTSQEAGWSNSNSKKAVWKAVSHAPGYALTLYGNDKVVKRMTVTDNSADLSDYMKDSDKYYYYEVKAVPMTDAQKKYLKEGDIVLSGERTLEESESHGSDSDGSSGRWEDAGSFKGDHYIYPDGSKAVSTWKMIDGNWYYFGQDGSRSRGWMNYGGSWYYMDGNGVMQTGWIYPGDGAWYYLGADGNMQTGWVQQMPGTWYYLHGDGRMNTGWLFDNGSWYYMDTDGKMHTGWLFDNGSWYYLHQDGRMNTGWLLLNGSWYYMNPDGRMQTGWLLQGDVWYYMNGDGRMHTGWFLDHDNWYFFNGRGEMLVNTMREGWRIGADGIAGKE